MSPDLLLIHPGGAEGIYQDLALDHAAVEPPLWCRLIAGYCLDHGQNVEIIDAEAERLSPEHVAQRVTRARPRLVCIVAHGHQPSASTQSMVAAGAIARAIKSLNQNLPLIIVGGHVAALPERTLKEEVCDYACNSEGPITVLELLETIKAGSSVETVRGLVLKDGDAVRVNKAPPLLDLSELHGDAWRLLPMKKYRAHNWQVFSGSARQPYASIYTSLSCPFACSFCMIDAPFRASQPRKYRTRDPADVVNEIGNLYREYGVKTFKIVDEMFVLSPKHYVPICEGLAALPFADELNIWAYARVDTVKEGHLPLLRKAGIRWLALGIESGSAHVRDGADKTFSDADIIETVRAIQDAEIAVIGNFIFGLPDDTHGSMRATLDLAIRLNCEFANFYSAMAYPGSKLFDQANSEDLPKSWSGYSQHSFDTRPLPNGALSSEDILRFRDRAFLEYFTGPRYLDMIEKKFGLKARSEIDSMTAHRLYRDLLAA